MSSTKAQVIFNSTTKKIISPIFEQGYLVDGAPGKVLPPLVLLTVIDNVTPPVIDPSSQELSGEYVVDEASATYTKQYKVVTKSKYRKIQEIYGAKALQGAQIVEDMRKQMLLEHAAGILNENAIAAINAETKLAQIALKDGDLKTAEIIINNLPGSPHKTKFLAAIRAAQGASS